MIQVSEDKCYYCGKAVENEDLIMKNVSTGYFSSERKPFHKDCWKKYHATRMKKDAIEYIALTDTLLLLFVGLPAVLMIGIFGFMILALFIAILIVSGVAYYRIKD